MLSWVFFHKKIIETLNKKCSGTGAFFIYLITLQIQKLLKK